MKSFLILISFISFCFVVYDRLASQIELRFLDKISNINNLIISSLELMQKKLLQKKEMNLKYIYFKNIFTSLKIYYFNFSLIFFKRIF